LNGAAATAAVKGEWKEMIHRIIQAMARYLNIGQRHHVIIKWDNAHSDGGTWVDGKKIHLNENEDDFHPITGLWEDYFLPLSELP